MEGGCSSFSGALTPLGLHKISVGLFPSCSSCEMFEHRSPSLALGFHRWKPVQTPLMLQGLV